MALQLGKIRLLRVVVFVQGVKNPALPQLFPQGRVMRGALPQSLGQGEADLGPADIDGFPLQNPRGHEEVPEDGGGTARFLAGGLLAEIAGGKAAALFLQQTLTQGEQRAGQRARRMDAAAVFRR